MAIDDISQAIGKLEGRLDAINAGQVLLLSQVEKINDKLSDQSVAVGAVKARAEDSITKAQAIKFAALFGLGSGTGTATLLEIISNMFKGH